VLTCHCFAPVIHAKSGNMLDTPVGQLIVSACVIDDIIGLTILAVLMVLVTDNPPIYQYFIPFISGVVYVVVLGGSAVTWMPRFIERAVLSRCKDSYRNPAMFTVMTMILLTYLPLMNYTHSNYLTGAYLCGCIFSQIEHARHTFMEHTHQLMTWLLRMFFAATIGFQIPVKQFGNPYVIGWGFLLYLCVLSKLPLAFYIPQFEDVPKNTSYNPFLRDRILAGLAMTCRGELSFIIAAFSLRQGLLSVEMYAAIGLACLISCITSPFMLIRVIEYFNKKQHEYLSSIKPIKLASEECNNTDPPLFLHIKAKVPAFGGMQEKFRNIVNNLGLEIVDRRTNRNGRGLNATVQTDLFVRDTTINVKIQKIAAQRKIKEALDTAVKSMGNNSSIGPASMRRLRNGSLRLSSNNLSSLSLVSLEEDEHSALKDAAMIEDAIIIRGEFIEAKITEAVGVTSKVTVDM